MKKSVQGINETLFDMLEKLSDEKLQGAELCSMIGRAESIVGVVSQINNTADTVFKAAKLLSETNPKHPKIAQLLLDAVGKSDEPAVVEKK